MRISDYEWSRNPRGLHNKRVLITPLEIDRWSEMGAGWAKLVAAEGEYLNACRELLARNITPVIRPYRARWGARPMDREMRDQIIAYREVGVRWFEFYNEPNLPIEWPPGVNIHWQNSSIMIPLIENWMDWAEFIIAIGGYPGFTALAESDAPDAAAVPWYDTWFNYLADNYYERFRWILANGAYCATHPYILNHFYQQKPGGGPLSARQPEDQNGNEGGWHFEDPYDPICQASDPGRTVYGGTALTPRGDPVGLLAMGRMFNERCTQLFGTRAVPVFGTEGGIFPFSDQPFYQQDSRYPPYTHESQAEATVAMFNWISTNAPPWFFGVALWKEDDYFEPGRARAVHRMRESPFIARTVPDIPVILGDVRYPSIGDDAVFAPVPGPAPIHGQADFHIVIVAGGLDAGWFIDTTRAYWDQFRPIITNRAELADYITSDFSLAVTVIAPPDAVEPLRERIAGQYPNVWFDVVLATSAADVERVFYRRAQRRQRFG
jgi:hypothetical protein